MKLSKKINNFFIFFLLFFISFILTNFQQEQRIILEKEPKSNIPNDWKIIKNDNKKNSFIKITFALKQKNISELTKKFWDISNPNSINYGK